MYAYAIGYITPDSLALHLTVLFVAASIVGGARSVVGAILGAAVVVVNPVIATDINPALYSVIFGTALVVSVMLMPVGIPGAVRWFRKTPAVDSADGSSAGRSEEALLVGDATFQDAALPRPRALDADFAKSPVSPHSWLGSGSTFRAAR